MYMMYMAWSPDPVVQVPNVFSTDHADTNMTNVLVVIETIWKCMILHLSTQLIA